MTDCHSESKMSLFGRVPPRTPGRSDAQVPRDGALGPAIYARIPHLYFYATGDTTDAHFGFLDIEIALQRRNDGDIWIEAYCMGDGFQTSRGSGADHPLTIEMKSGSKVLASIRWHYPTVLCGHFDPMTFSSKTSLSAADFESVDCVHLPSVNAHADDCHGAPVVFGGPEGH